MGLVGESRSDPPERRFQAPGREGVGTAQTDWLCWDGRPTSAADPEGRALETRELARRLLDGGPEALDSLRGAFAIAWFQASTGTLFLARDHFGIEPLFVACEDGGLFFASGVARLQSERGGPHDLDREGLRDYLRYGFVPGETTLITGVRAVRPGSCLRVRRVGDELSVEESIWYRPSFAGDATLADEDEICSRFLDALTAAVDRSRVDGAKGVMISGGLDSSAVACLLTKPGREGVQAFTFRCREGAFDESRYARELAERLRLPLEIVEYEAADALRIEAAARAMDTPFCDAGIEVATWLTARAAGGRVPIVYTGDGGDEVWASHPVYAAQRLLRPYDRAPLPRTVRRTLRALLDTVRDSDDKRDLRVVMKRLLPDPRLPAALLHHRWRIYYVEPELSSLLGERPPRSDDWEAALESFVGFGGAPGSGDRMLYSDYRFAVPFYLRRLLLFRAHGVRAHVPFLDPDLVALGARIPFRRKLERIERTKRLFRRSMEGIVPNTILARTDKLGHSIPMKNWLRHDPAFRDLVRDRIWHGVAGARELVQRPAVARLFDEHVSGRSNHSHRIWALFVLDCWLEAHSVT